MLFRDLFAAARVLWKSRGFTMAAVVTIALGLGVNAAVFILYDAALYESLPVRKASELYRVITWTREGGNHFDFSYPHVDLRDAPQSTTAWRRTHRRGGDHGRRPERGSVSNT